MHTFSLVYRVTMILSNALPADGWLQLTAAASRSICDFKVFTHRMSRTVVLQYSIINMVHTVLRVPSTSTVIDDQYRQWKKLVEGHARDLKSRFAICMGLPTFCSNFGVFQRACIVHKRFAKLPNWTRTWQFPLVNAMLKMVSFDIEKG